MEIQELSWFERIKRGLKLDTLHSKLDLSRGRLVEIAVFLAIGFLLGILWKKYSQYVAAALVFVVVLVVLQHLEIINIFINWQAVQEMCGFDTTQADLSTMLWAWCKCHFLSLLALGIGISVGMKVS